MGSKPATGKVTYYRDVLPILTKQCLGCHSGLRQKGGLDMRTIPAMLKGGRVVLPLSQVQGWRKTCDGLARSFDNVLRGLR